MEERRFVTSYCKQATVICLPAQRTEPSHPQHTIAKQQIKDFGGIISFLIECNKKHVLNFCKKTKLFSLAESLGVVESLVEVPSIMTHASIPAEQRLKLGITDNLIRLSVGIENVDDLVDDLKQAL